MKNKAGRPKGKEPMLHVGTTLPKETIQALDTFAEQNDRTRAWVIRKAVETFVKAK